MDTNANSLANSANKVVPTPKANAAAIAALVKSDGQVCGYRLSDGRNVSREEGVALAKAGDIKGVAVAENQGTEYLRGLPDGKEDNNLGNLPTVTG